jgi:hypothetical protein
MLRRPRCIRQQRENSIGHRTTVAQILRDALCVFIKLLQQHRREIDDCACGGIAFQMRRHVGVILYCVQQRPGECVLAAERVAILRLVHVPQQHHRQPAGYFGFGAGH